MWAVRFRLLPSISATRIMAAASTAQVIPFSFRLSMAPYAPYPAGRSSRRPKRHSMASAMRRQAFPSP